MSKRFGCDDDDLTQAEKLIRRLASCMFFISNFDPFAIYKRNFKLSTRSHYQYYQVPELRLNVNNYDKWRQRFRRFSVWAYSVVVVRVTLICLVQLAKYQAMTSVSSENRSVIHDTELIKLLKQMHIYYLFGNVLADFHGVSFALHIVLFISITYSIYYLPLYYTIKPPDAVDLRMGYDPSRERRRLDMLLREAVEGWILSTEAYKISLQMLVEQIAYPAYRQNSMIKLFESVWWQQQLKHRQANLKVGFVFDEQLRPSQYKLGHKRYWQTIKYVFLLIVLSSILFAITIHLYVTERTVEFRCQTRQLDGAQCNILEAFDWCEILSLVEIVCLTYWLGCMLCTSILSIIAHMDAHSRSISEMEADLRDLLGALRLINCWSDDYEHHFTAEDQRLIQWIRIEKEHHLRGALLKMLAKAKVMLGEFRSRANFVAEQVSVLMVLFIAAIVLSVTAVKLQGPDIQALRNNIIGCLWAAANVILISCAHNYSRFILLQRIGWAILAQLNRKLARESKILDKNYTYLDPLMLGWRRLIEGGSLCDRRCSIHAFGISLTFKQTLEMNFYVTSLAAFVLR